MAKYIKTTTRHANTVRSALALRHIIGHLPRSSTPGPAIIFLEVKTHNLHIILILILILIITRITIRLFRLLAYLERLCQTLSLSTVSDTLSPSAMLMSESTTLAKIAPSSPQPMTTGNVVFRRVCVIENMCEMTGVV